MKRIFTSFVLVLAFIFFLPTAPAHLEQKGMALGLFSKDPHYSYLKDLQELKALGVTHVLLVVSWYQKNVQSNEMGPREFDGNDILTLPDSKLEEVIDQAHSLGIKAVVFPILRLEERHDNDWRGVIKPQDINTWWAHYTNFVLHYARIAASKKVEIFSVGSELLSRENETQRWETLIAEVRKTFGGELIYSANWDHYEHPQFWKSLDWIGVTAYYEISKTKRPTFTQLVTSWKKIRSQLLAWKKKYPKQRFVITEVGYPSIDGATMYPWNYFLEGRVDLREQALAYQAFIYTWKNTKQLAGAYFWAWWGDGGPKDNSYTPRGKPAERHLKAWYASGK